MAAYPQSVAYTRVFYAYLTSDHVSAATGKTITMNVSKAGGAFAAAGGTITEIANGAYKIALTTTDTNTAGDMTFYGTASATDDIKFTDQVTTQVFSTTSWGGITSSQLFLTSGYTAPDNTSITGIKAKTDSLTFTVAGQVDSNTQYVNDVQVKGVGTVADPWNPV